MGRLARLAAAATCIVAMAPRPGVADPLVEAPVARGRHVVRVYDSAAIPADRRTQAIGNAREILARTDVEIEWRDCQARESAACTEVPTPGELIVRMVSTPLDTGTRHTLGMAYIDSVTGTGTLATVFVDRIKAVTKDGSADPWSMVGRVMAHEIGHLLLGSNAHSETGLMRPIWTQDDLASNRREDWLFSAAQQDRLRNRPAPPRYLTPASSKDVDPLAM